VSTNRVVLKIMWCGGLTITGLYEALSVCKVLHFTQICCFTKSEIFIADTEILRFVQMFYKPIWAFAHMGHWSFFLQESTNV